MEHRTEWIINYEGETVILNATTFEIEGNSIVFKKRLGRTDIYTNIACYPCNKTVVKEKTIDDRY